MAAPQPPPPNKPELKTGHVETLQGGSPWGPAALKATLLELLQDEEVRAAIREACVASASVPVELDAGTMTHIMTLVEDKVRLMIAPQSLRRPGQSGGSGAS